MSIDAIMTAIISILFFPRSGRGRGNICVCGGETEGVVLVEQVEQSNYPYLYHYTYPWFVNNMIKRKCVVGKDSTGFSS